MIFPVRVFGECAIGLPLARLIDILKDLRPNVLDVLQTREGERRLFIALEKLGELEKTVIIAHEFEGVPFRELARRLDMPQNTLLSHKSRAMKKLKNYFLSSEGGTL